MCEQQGTQAKSSKVVIDGLVVSLDTGSKVAAEQCSACSAVQCSAAECALTDSRHHHWLTGWLTAWLAAACPVWPDGGGSRGLPVLP